MGFWTIIFGIYGGGGGDDTVTPAMGPGYVILSHELVHVSLPTHELVNTEINSEL